VIVETVEDGRTRAQHYTVDTLSEVTLLRSLVLAVNQKQPGAHVTLYVDCVSQGMVATPRAMRDMFHKMARPRLQVVSFHHMSKFRGTRSEHLRTTGCFRKNAFCRLISGVGYPWRMKRCFYN
jgi:hypothetical protein